LIVFEHDNIVDKKKTKKHAIKSKEDSRNIELVFKEMFIIWLNKNVIN